MKLEIEQYGPWEPLKYMLRTYPERMQYVRERVTQELGARCQEIVRRRLKRVSDPEYKLYLKSLRVAEVRTSGRKTIVVLESVPKPVRLDGRDMSRTVVNFHGRGGRKLHPLSQILAENGPWTIDTLPGAPLPDVEAVYSVVSRRETESVRKRVQGIQGELRATMIRLGVKTRPVKKEDLGKVMAKADTTMLGLRLEFGLAGHPHVPHWGPALRELRKSWRNILRQSTGGYRMLRVPTDTSWNRRKTRLPVTSAQKLVGYSRFVRKIRGA